MLDTRTKIVTLDEARRRIREAKANGREVRAVIGYFDPLLPTHAAHLAKLADRDALFAIVDTPADAYLELAARAELAASLGFIECVITGNQATAEALGADETLHEHDLEDERRQEFIHYVRDRARS